VAEIIACTPKSVPLHLIEQSGDTAIRHNPLNAPPVSSLRTVAPGMQLTRMEIAVMTSKYWGAAGVNLTVGFLDGPDSGLRARILSHMNAWGRSANVRFRETAGAADVRIARTPGDGYWSYLGTDIHVIPADQPTMNLQSFTLAVDESEFVRVVRHETGHTLGFPHEHLRRALVEKIDRAKAIAFYLATQGWDENMTVAQVLTPIEEAQLIATPVVDVNSIMCYQIPAAITKDGLPIAGGVDIDDVDAAFAQQLYPLPVADPILQIGSSGADVLRLQNALGALGFPPGPIDGFFGPLTAAAVANYQVARGLTVDGIVGPETWGSLHTDGY
jgi:hypothetical protein